MGKVEKGLGKDRGHAAFFGMLYAEGIKMRRTWILWLHILMPVIGITVFLLYYCISVWSDWGKISAYVEVVSIVCPTLVGFVTALAAEQEKQAGHFQNILGIGKFRGKNLAVKLCSLLIWNLLAVSLTIGGFGAGFYLFVSRISVPVKFYFEVILLIWICQIFAYELHLFLGLRFSKGITIGAGIVESVVSALMMTGLGERIWQWIPCAWAGRLSGYCVKAAADTGINVEYMMEQMRYGGVAVAVATLAGTALLFVWFARYEGRRMED